MDAWLWKQLKETGEHALPTLCDLVYTSWLFSVENQHLQEDNYVDAWY